jgi:hypothetical protein
MLILMQQMCISTNSLFSADQTEKAGNPEEKQSDIKLIIIRQEINLCTSEIIPLFNEFIKFTCVLTVQRII